MVKGNNKYSFDASAKSFSNHSHINNSLNLNTQSNLSDSKSLLMKELFISSDCLSDSSAKFSTHKSFSLSNTKEVFMSKHFSNLSPSHNLFSSEMSYFHDVDNLLNSSESYKKSISLNTLNSLQDKHLLNSIVLSSVNDSFSSAEYSR